MQSICSTCGKTREIVSRKEIRIRGGSYLIPQAIKEMSCRTCRVWSRAVAQLQTYDLLLLDQAIINWSEYIRQYWLGGRSGFLTSTNLALVNFGVLARSYQGESWAIFDISMRHYPWDPTNGRLLFIRHRDAKAFIDGLLPFVRETLFLQYTSVSIRGVGDKIEVISHL